MESTEVVKALKALSCEKRLGIVKLLVGRNRCVGALAKELDASQPLVSQHLRVLRDAGIVQDQRCGYHVHYTVKRELLEEIKGYLSTMLQGEKEGAECPERGQEC